MALEQRICRQGWDSLCKCKSPVKDVKAKAKSLKETVKNVMERKYNRKQKY